MESKTQLVGYSVLTLVFVSLFLWYSNDFIATAPHEPDIQSAWPDGGTDRETLDWIEGSWQIESMRNSPTEEVFRFWFLTSFENSYIVTTELTSRVSAAVSVTVFSPEYWLGSTATPYRLFDGALSQSEIVDLKSILESVHFWSSPPGELRWTCLDGDSYIVETNIGGNYRLWSNACEASPSMRPIADFFSEIANRVSGITTLSSLEMVSNNALH